MLHCEVRQKAGYITLIEVGRMTSPMEDDVTANPIRIRFLCPGAETPRAHRQAHTLHQAILSLRLRLGTKMRKWNKRHLEETASRQAIPITVSSPTKEQPRRQNAGGGSTRC